MRRSSGSPPHHDIGSVEPLQRADPADAPAPSLAESATGGGARPLGTLAGSRWWVRLLVAVTAAGLAGLLLGLTMPRGPVTSGQALVAMLTGLVVGGVAGTSLRTRWALVVAPLVLVTILELVRMDVVGPTVDAPRLGALGITALLVGRGFDGLVLLAPMLLGATLGVAFARRRWPELTGQHPDPAGTWLRVRRGLTGLVAIGLIALALLLARPASTAPIVGPDGEPLAGSIAELVTVPIGGHDQVLLIRGERSDAPVLLWLAGGPGGSDIGPMRNLGEQLERAFVVVTWEQRGAGKSYRALEPIGSMTLEQAVNDTLEVTDHLRERFGRERIHIAGNSWGTLPSVLAVQRHPERYEAFVGVGQMVDILATDRMFFEDTLAYARERGDAALEERLLTLGPPPYDDFLDYEPGVFAGEHLWNDYPRVPGSRAKGEMPANVLAREFTLIEGIRSGGAALDTLAVLYPRLQDVDLRAEVPRLDVPVYLVQGRHEARGRAVLAEEWFEQLDAPDKELIVFERSGHRPMFEEPDRFFEVMTETVLARTQAD